MGVEIAKPQSPMGRRMFALAAPLVGAAYGGPAGAAVGGVIGSRVGGASMQDAMASGVGAGIDEKKDAMARRLAQSKENPQVAIKAGLDALAGMDPKDPLRQTYEADLVRAQMLAEQKPRYGLGVNTNLMQR